MGHSGSHKFEVVVLLSTLMVLVALVGRRRTKGLEERFGPRQGVAVVWVVKTQDCPGCQQLTPVVRKLLREAGLTIRLYVVHLGKAEDEGQITRYLAAERVIATVITRTSAAFRAQYRVTTPVIILMRNGEPLLVREGARRLDEDQLFADFKEAIGLHHRMRISQPKEAS